MDYQFSITDLFDDGFDISDINEIKNAIYGYEDGYGNQNDEN